MNTLQQAILSGGIGGVNVVIYLTICKMFDRYMSENTSNMLGLIIDFVLNYLSQQLVFYGKIMFRKDIMYRFAIGNSISIITQQVLFVYGRPMYMKIIKRYPHIVKSNYRVTLWRYISNVMIYLLVTFPLRKFFIFK
jgi:hypothetical protein